MSRRRKNNINVNPKVEELEDEYKDPSIVENNEENKEELLPPICEFERYNTTESQPLQGRIEIQNTANETKEPNTSSVPLENIVLKNNTYIKETMDHTSKSLMVHQLKESDRDEYCSNLVRYSIAIIKKGTMVTCTPCTDQWYKIDSGYIFNGDIEISDINNRILSMHRNITRINDVRNRK